MEREKDCFEGVMKTQLNFNIFVNLVNTKQIFIVQSQYKKKILQRQQEQENEDILK